MRVCVGEGGGDLFWQPCVQFVEGLHHVGPLQDGGAPLVALMEDKVAEQLQQVPVACRGSGQISVR